MHTIQALENDIFSQPEFLKKFKPHPLVPISKQNSMIFCGTGDSYVAALLAESFSNLHARAADPLDLVKNLQLAKNKTVYLISISGNTASNIKLAKKVNSVAVTTNPKSKLAKSCKKIIKLEYHDSGVFTAGSIGFLCSALTCMSLVKKIQMPDVTNLFENAIKISKSVKLCGKIFVLGNLYTYPIAMYAAAKLYEILGNDAHYEKIEQFSHMGLFSTKKGDTVIILDEKNPHNKRLIHNLKKIGLNVIEPDFVPKTILSSVLFFTFLAQLIPLFAAKKKSQKQCYFVTAKNIRNASSDMIY